MDAVNVKALSLSALAFRTLACPGDSGGGKRTRTAFESEILTAVRQKLDQLRRGFLSSNPGFKRDPSNRITLKIEKRDEDMQRCDPDPEDDPETADKDSAGSDAEGGAGNNGSDSPANGGGHLAGSASLKAGAEGGSRGQGSNADSGSRSDSAQGRGGAIGSAAADGLGAEGTDEMDKEPPSVNDLVPFEETDSFDPLITHGLLNAFRQDQGSSVNDIARVQYRKSQSRGSVKGKIETMLKKMYEPDDVIKTQVKRVDEWCSVFNTVGLLKHDQQHVESIPILPPMVYELARNGDVVEVDKFWNTELGDQACDWLWKSCEDWTLPWEAIRLAERGQFDKLEKTFSRSVHRQVYDNLWKVNEQYERPLPAVVDIATKADMYEYPNRYGSAGERIANEAYRWLWRKSRHWHCGNRLASRIESSSLPEDRLLEIDLQQDRLLANIDHHMSSVTSLKAHRHQLLETEERVVRALLARRRSKAQTFDSMLAGPRVRPVYQPDGPRDRCAKLRMGVLKHCTIPKPRPAPAPAPAPVKQKVKEESPPRRVVTAKRNLVPKLMLKPILGKNDVPIQTRMLSWQEIVSKFKPVSMGKKRDRAAQNSTPAAPKAPSEKSSEASVAKPLKKTVFTPKFVRVKPGKPAADSSEPATSTEGVTAPPGVGVGEAEESSDGEENTDDEYYIKQHTSTLQEIKDKFAQFWERQKRKKEEAREKRTGQGGAVKKKSSSNLSHGRGGGGSGDTQRGDGSASSNRNKVGRSGRKRGKSMDGGDGAVSPDTTETTAGSPSALAGGRNARTAKPSAKVAKGKSKRKGRADGDGNNVTKRTRSGSISAGAEAGSGTTTPVTSPSQRASRSRTRSGRTTRSSSRRK